MADDDVLLTAEPEAVGRAYFGQGQGDIYLENVQCNGSEAMLDDCPASDIGVHDCDHTEDAGVRCQGTYVCTPIPNNLRGCTGLWSPIISSYVRTFVAWMK